MTYTPRMTDEQREAMMARFPETRTEVLAGEFGVSYRTVCRWAVKLGLKKTRRFLAAASAAARTVSTKHYYGQPPKRGRSQLTDNEAFMRQHFATTMNDVLARLLGVNERTIRRWSQDLGLRKDMRVIYQNRNFMKTKNQTKGQAIPADIYEQLERLAYQVIIRLCENRLEQLDSVTVEEAMQTIGQPEAKTQAEVKPADDPLPAATSETSTKNGKHSKEQISDETANRIVELYRHGSIIAEIQKQLGIKSTNTIYRYLRKNGIEPHRMKNITKHKEETPADSDPGEAGLEGEQAQTD